MGRPAEGDDHGGGKSFPPVKDLRLMPSSHADHDLRSGPPPHVQAAVDQAWERAQDLFAGELELHFALDQLTRRVAGELRTPAGEVWERLSASEALAIACGDVALISAGAPRAADVVAA
jgi:hypothetical protein